jgi:hypothetical protein
MDLVAAGSIALAVASFVHFQWISQFFRKPCVRSLQPAGCTFPDSDGMNNILMNNAEESP